MLDQAPCGPAVPCLSRQARAAVMVRLRGEADAGHRSAVSGHRSPVKRVIGRQCHSGVSVIRVNTGMVNFRKFLLPNKAVIFLKIFREIYICPKRWHTRGGRVVGGDRRIPSYGGDYRATPGKIRTLTCSCCCSSRSAGSGTTGVGEILRKAANVLQNKLTRAQYLDEVTWTTKNWLGLQKQRISVVPHGNRRAGCE